MKKTCIIVDDEPQSLSEIRLFVEQTGLLEVLATSNLPSEAIQLVLTLKPDLVIADIQMPELIGTEMAGVIQKNHLCKFIFVTGHPDYALESYKLDTIHYLIKPVRYIDVYQAITKFLRFSGQDGKPSAHNQPRATIDLSLMKKGEKMVVALADISFLQSQDKISVLFYKDGSKIQVRESLKMLEKLLPGDRFVKAQRSYIISLDGLTQQHLTARYLVLPHTQHHISISRDARQVIKGILQKRSIAHI
jgi:two-component system, LytTR family, response regulator LytT